MPAAPTSWLEPYDLAGELAAVDRAVMDIGSEEESIADVCGHLFHPGGKRLRPALVFLTARIRGGASAPLSVAVAVELLHTATLVHDDVMDGSDTRRHRSSVSARWGNAMATFAGGYLFAKAMDLFASAGEPINRAANHTIEEMWRGQNQEAQNVHNLDIDEETYFKIIARKTAALHELSCRVGGLSADVPPSDLELLAGYGRDLGVAFQLVDDILDLVADEATLGKPSAVDVRGGIYTLAIIRTLARADADAKRLRAILSDRHMTVEGVSEVLEIVRHNGSVQSAAAAAESMRLNAQRRLDSLPNSAAKDALRRLAEHVVMVAG